ncbi:MAG: thioredoxin [Maricaulaceae bacterium]
MTDATQVPTDIVKNGTDAAFMADVIETSKTTPVVVDFWAPWCGPCKQLMPALERSVLGAKGKVKLVKINIDQNPGVAGQLGVQSIPAVFAFKDGQPVDGFQGAQPESELKKFVARLSGESDVVAESAEFVARGRDSLAAGDPGGAAQDFAQAMQLNPENPEALAGLARVYMDGGNETGAAEIIALASEKVQAHPEVAAVRAALQLKEEPTAPDETAELLAAVEDKPDDLDARYALAKALAGVGRNADAVDHLLYSIGKNRMHKDEIARKFLLTIFEAEGTDSEVSIDGRRRLSSILFA